MQLSARKIALWRNSQRIVVDVILSKGRNFVDQKAIVAGTITS